jgi:transposase-like protein
MTGGVGSVRELTVMIATEGIFVWRAVTRLGNTLLCRLFESNNRVEHKRD